MKRTIEASGRPHDDVRAEVHDYLSKGKSLRCPCCDQNAGVNTRKMNAHLARQVRFLAMAVGSQWVEDIIAAGRGTGVVSGLDRQYSLLKFWGLIEPTENQGYWRITEQGLKFVAGEIDVPLRIFVYNNAMIGVRGEERITFEQAMKERFDLPDVFATEEHLDGDTVDTEHTREAVHAL